MSERITRLDDVLVELGKLGITGASQRKNRAEDMQTRQKSKRFTSLKKESGQSQKLLFITEIALPFDPRTGSNQEEYNERNKFRPLYSGNYLASALKDEAKYNQKLKDALMRRAGVKEWDIDDYVDIFPVIKEITRSEANRTLAVKSSVAKEELIRELNVRLAAAGGVNDTLLGILETKTFLECFSDTDMLIFRNFRETRIFTTFVFSTNFKSLINYEGASNREYIINAKRDENYQIMGELPLFILTNQYMVSLAIAEANAYDEAVEKMPEAKRPNAADKKTYRQNIWKKIRVSGDDRRNEAVVLALPLGNTMELIETTSVNPAKFASYTDDEIFKLLRKVRINKAITNALDSYKNGTWSSYDFSLSVLEIDMAVADVQGGPEVIGQNTTYSHPTIPIRDYPYANGMLKRFDEYIDNAKDMEDVYIDSTTLTVYDEKVEKALAAAILGEYEFDASEFATDEIISKHIEFLYNIYGSTPRLDRLMAEMNDQAGTNPNEAEAVIRKQADALRESLDMDDVDLEDEHSSEDTEVVEDVSGVVIEQVDLSNIGEDVN